MTARFAVRVSVPVYHFSTDAYVGDRVTTHNIFPTLAEAVDYAWLENAEANACGDWDVDFFVAIRREGKWCAISTEVYAPATEYYCFPWNGPYFHSPLCEETDRRKYCTNYPSDTNSIPF